MHLNVRAGLLRFGNGNTITLVLHGIGIFQRVPADCLYNIMSRPRLVRALMIPSLCGITSSGLELQPTNLRFTEDNQLARRRRTIHPQVFTQLGTLYYISRPIKLIVCTVSILSIGCPPPPRTIHILNRHVPGSAYMICSHQLYV